MALALAFPENYRYVIAPAVASCFVNVFHSSLTSKFRKAAKVPFPNAYVTANEAATSKEKFRFNCAQKAHANFAENQPTFLVALLTTGLQFPMLAAGLGAVWNLGRVVYALGYTREHNAENGKGRMIGVWWALAHYVLIGTAGVASVKLLMA